MHITMDLTTFLAICTVVAGAGTFGITALRIRKNGRAILKNESGQVEAISISKVYSIVRDKIQEFYEGTCKSERTAVREVLRIEMKGIKRVLETEIKQMNTTLTKGLNDIRIEIENGNSDTSPKSCKKI